MRGRARATARGLGGWRVSIAPKEVEALRGAGATELQLRPGDGKRNIRSLETQHQGGLARGRRRGRVPEDGGVGMEGPCGGVHWFSWREKAGTATKKTESPEEKKRDGGGK